MADMYSTTAVVIGGRKGRARTDDGLLDITLAMPKSLGGKGGATNPEQLFAAGYAACFSSALALAAGKRGLTLKDDDIEIAATVGIGQNGTGGFALSVALVGTLTGVDQAMAEEIMAAAHEICPYSNAVRGNITVDLTAKVR